MHRVHSPAESPSPDFCRRRRSDLAGAETLKEQEFFQKIKEEIASVIVEWCARRDDLRTFLGHFLTAAKEFKFSAGSPL
jgi:hypothetical protein